VEILPELHRAAEENIRLYESSTQRCENIETILVDACKFEFPSEPLVLYLFNPLPQRALSETLQRLEKSLTQTLRPAWVVYHNPLLEAILSASAIFEKAGGTGQYCLFRTSAAR
jgi:hypothetical protein